MAQAYTRQSSFSDGDSITASLFNNEYNQLVNVFAYSSSSASSTGHRHDGTAGEGGNIFKIGDLDFLNKVEIDSTNNRIGFYTEVSSAAVEQLRIQDGALVPVTDSDIDLGTTSLRFKDTFTDSITTTGNVDVGGNLTVTGTTTFNGGTLTLGDAADDNVVFGADVNSNIIPNTDNTYDLGSSSQEWKDLYVDGIAYLDGINFNGTAITSTAAELNILDGVTSTTAELNLLDGVTATTTELNYVDVTTAGTVEASKAVVADSNADVLFSDNDKLKFGTGSDLQLYHDGTHSYAANSTGSFYLRTASSLQIENSDGSEDLATFAVNGAATLFHDNSAKLATTSTGVDVTGTVVADGLTVDSGTTNTVATFTSTDAGAGIQLTDPTGSSKLETSGVNLRISIDDDGAVSNSAIQFRVDGSTKATINDSGVLDVDGGITVDNITIDGTEIDLSSGDLTLDSAGDIILDADGGDIKFQDAGTHWLNFGNAAGSSAVHIDTKVSDHDLKFRGNDGGSTITALTLDMSDAGTATFNHDVKLGDGGEAIFGASTDLRIAHDSTDSFITNNTGDLYINQFADDKDILFRSDDGSGGIATYFFLDGSGTRTQFQQHTRHIDNIYAAFGSDADLRIFHDGSNSYIKQSSGATGNLIIEQDLTDADILFKGDDGGSTITALTLDMSNNGRAVFNAGAGFSDHVNFDDNAKAVFGGGDDMSIYHNATDTYIQNATGNLIIENTLDDKDIIIKSDDGSGGTAAYITLDGSAALTQFDKDTKHVDSVKATFGDSSDLQIFHDSSNSFIQDTGTGDLIVRASNNLYLQSYSGAENYLVATTDGAVELYHDNSKKIETTSSGISVTGNVALTGDIQKTGQITLDASTDIALDTDSGIILLKDGGTNKGRITTASDIISIVNSTQDGDIKFDGLDGSSSITALRLDMSEAGAATFNSTVTGKQFLTSGNTGVQGVQIGEDAGNTSNSGRLFFTESGGSWAIFNSNDSLSFNNGGTYGSSSGTQRAFLTAAGNLNIDGTYAGDVVSAHTTENTVANDDVIAFYDTSAGAIRKTAVSNLPGGSGSAPAADDIATGDAAVTIGTSTGDITLDTPGSIILDADNNAEVSFQDAGTEIGKIFNSSSDFAFESGVQDKDIIFRGNDGGTGITALTLDMSAGGTAQFAHDIEMVDNGLLRMGAGGDLILTSDGTNGTIFTNNGALILDADSDIHLDADGGDIYFKDAGTEFLRLQNDSGNINIRQDTSDKDILFLGNDGGSSIVALTLDMSEAGAATFNNNVTAFSDERLKDNIETLEDGLAKVEQLRGVTYTRDDREEIGVIAQEVEKILPEIVLTADDEMGTKSVDYSRITAVLIEAVKELSERVKELENK